MRNLTSLLHIWLLISLSPFSSSLPPLLPSSLSPPSPPSHHVHMHTVQRYADSVLAEVFPCVVACGLVEDRYPTIQSSLFNFIMALWLVTISRLIYFSHQMQKPCHPILLMCDLSLTPQKWCGCRVGHVAKAQSQSGVSCCTIMNMLPDAWEQMAVIWKEYLEFVHW